MGYFHRFELALTASLVAAFSIAVPWFWFTGCQWSAAVLGAVCILASALVFVVSDEAFGR